MTFFGDLYLKSGSIKQGFELPLPFLMHGAEMYHLHCTHNCKMKVSTGLDFSVRESWADGDINGAS